MRWRGKEHHDRLAAKLRRVASLVRKEGRQVIRDPSSVAIGIVLPVLLILLFGYGLSLDVRDVPIAIVLEDPSPTAMELAAGFRLSPYFSVRFTPSMAHARDLMHARQVDGIVRIRSDFGRRLGRWRRGSADRGPRGRCQPGAYRPNLRRGGRRPMDGAACR